MPLSGETIICLSSIDWHGKWQAPQQLMTALARDGNRVLFVENTGVRSPWLRDIPRLARRLGNRRGGPVRREACDVSVYSPLVLPFPYGRIAGRFNAWAVARTVRRWAGPGRRPILWTFLPTPLAVDLAAALKPALTVYHCLDDFASSSPRARRIVASEDELLRSADVVFVTAARLEARARRFRSVVHTFPSGVDYATFQRVREGADEPPADLRTLPRPLVGYVGGLNQKTDRRLLAEIARKLPLVHFVVIGPTMTNAPELKDCPNVHLLGFRTHEEIPHYLKWMSVAIIPTV